MMAAIFSCFNVVTFACLGLIAVLRPIDLATYLVVALDLGAMAYSIAAGSVGRVVEVCRIRTRYADTLFRSYSA